MSSAARPGTTFELAAAVLGVAAWGLASLFIAARMSAETLQRAKDAAEFLALALGVPAAVFGLFNHARSVSENRRTELWRRREFVLEQVRLFEAAPGVKVAMDLLDYNARRVAIPGFNGRVRVGEKGLLGALAPKGPRPSYSKLEVALRDAFDQFFGELDRLGVMREAGLLELEDLRPYVEYWLELLDGGPRARSADFGPIIRTYIAWFCYEGLERLMDDVGVATFEESDEVVAKSFAERLAKEKRNDRKDRKRRGVGPEEEDPEDEKEDDTD